MASRTEYPGYVKLPKKKVYKTNVCLAFNGQINSRAEGTKLEGFSLRLHVLKKGGEEPQPEMSVTLRPEEWLDLIDAMKEEFEIVSKYRKKFDDMR